MIAALHRFWFQHAKNHTTAEVASLREAVDDLWCAITTDSVTALQPETVTIAKRNHELLWRNTTETQL